MDVKLDVVKIMAVGSDKRFMWIRNKTPRTQEEIFKCVFIDDLTYQNLKRQGVPTGQKLGATGKKK